MLTWLKRLFRRENRDEVPDSMLDLRGSDPCWCGSGRKYARCHRPEDRRMQRKLGISPKTIRNNPFICKPRRKGDI